MTTLNQLFKEELANIKKHKPMPCVICGTKKLMKRWQTDSGVVCKDCYIKATNLGIATMLKQKEG